ncbi:hypothetical protein EIP91_010310 [Steccherinum ochraceum]|uniref:Uncharacterized protein n=1 Tax=Steccherinum ochraceum TaxID=92696 RepID=A0A4R0R3D2_9APHY|nr:hypothetical protein EIP91_010310 [Steccherinum ochraceum]
MASSSLPSTTVPPILVPELLGFVPQFLLDDIVDTANDEVRQAIDAMEGFLRRWVITRSEKVGDWDSNQDVEQGLVAFQTLLYNHVDIAFDFFEAWSMRNMFNIPPELPIVAPHQQGLNLDRKPDEETMLVADIEGLRRKINAQRKLQRLYSLAVRASAAQRAQSESRLQKLSQFRSSQLEALQRIPADFTSMYSAVSSLPPHDHASITAPPDLGKRPWETNKTGYLNWAKEQLVARTQEEEAGAASSGSAVVVSIKDRFGVWFETYKFDKAENPLLQDLEMSEKLFVLAFVARRDTMDRANHSPKLFASQACVDAFALQGVTSLEGHLMNVARGLATPLDGVHASSGHDAAQTIESLVQQVLSLQQSNMELLTENKCLKELMSTWFSPPSAGQTTDALFHPAVESCDNPRYHAGVIDQAFLTEEIAQAQVPEMSGEPLAWQPEILDVAHAPDMPWDDQVFYQNEFQNQQSWEQ